MEGLPRSEQRKKNILVDFAIGIKPMHIKLLVITSVSFVILLKTGLMQIECLPKLQGPRWEWEGKKYWKQPHNL